jgi:hypothetical protein
MKSPSEVNMKKRSKARVAEIDRIIRRDYPQYGADYVAEQLGEPRGYIQSRAWYLKVRTTKRRSGASREKQKSYTKRLREERDYYRRLYQAEVLRRKRLEKKLEERYA